MSNAVSEKRSPRAGMAGALALGAIVLAIAFALILAVKPFRWTTLGAAATVGAVASGSRVDEAAGKWAAVLRAPMDAGEAAQDLSWLKTGMTQDGRPWIGAAVPTLEIDEFVDFQCPKCCEACPFLQRLLSNFPDKVRIYIRHLPRTAQGAPGDAEGSSTSCQLARAAICAGRQGQYWEAHDYLFHHREQLAAQNTCVSALCQQLGLDHHAFRACLDDPTVKQALARDVDEARRLGITETPTFVAGGKPYRGGIPDQVLADLFGHDGG